MGGFIDSLIPLWRMKEDGATKNQAAYFRRPVLAKSSGEEGKVIATADSH
jgi:hypothetical protein